MVVAWFILWVVALVWCVAVVSQIEPGTVLSTGLIRSGLALGVGALVLLPVCGYLLARANRWSYVWTLIAYVWVLLLAFYIFAMLTAPTGDGTSGDTAAGAGLVILGVPLLLLVAAFVGFGVGTSALFGALSRRRTRSRLAQ